MELMAQVEHHNQLRAWARGDTTAEAAVELLIRAFNGRFADRGNAWVVADGPRVWIDWDKIPEWTGGLSGGERRFVLLVGSLGGGEPADLSDVSMLDYALQDLLVDALRHAGGRKVF